MHISSFIIGDDPWNKGESTRRFVVDGGSGEGGCGEDRYRLTMWTIIFMLLAGRGG